MIALPYHTTPHHLTPRLIALAVSALALVPLGCRDVGEDPGASDQTVTFKEETAKGIPAGYSRPYAFSDDWFSNHIPVWEQVFASVVGKPGLHYLEIGVFEGRALLWMMEHVLTHPTSRFTAIDIFIPAEVEQRFLDNVRLSGQEERVTTIRGSSQAELRELPLESFDIIYVDGSHTADDVLADAVLAWGLLKNGGIIIFDDFTWNGNYYAGPDSRLPAELTPAMAIYTFVQANRNYLNVIYSGYQVVLQKHPNPCPNKSICSPLGDYTYDWKDKTLFRGPDRVPVALTENEVRALETIFWNRSFRGRFVVPPSVLEKPEVAKLVDRLGLEAEVSGPGQPN